MNKLLFILLLTIVSANSFAVLVSGTAKINQENQVTIDYVFEGTETDTFLFEVYFDYDLFDNLSITALPDNSDWDVLAFQSIPDFFEDAALSFESFGDALAIGELLTGFQATVDYIGAEPLTEISQTAFIYDPFDFDAPPRVANPKDPSPSIMVETVSVNAPATSLLLVSAMFILFAFRKHKGYSL